MLTCNSPFKGRRGATRYFSRFTKSLGVALALFGSFAVEEQAHAVVIDFDAFPGGFSGGTVDGFTYSAMTNVAVDSNFLGAFSGANSLHTAGPGQNGFTLSFGSTFNFVSLMSGSTIGAVPAFTITGFLGAAPVGVDTFQPLLGSYNLFTAVNLAGVSVDSLVFDFGNAVFGPTHIDDLTLNVITQNFAAVSAETTGLPMANAQGQALLGAGQTVTNDINNHLFNLRNGGGEESADGSIASSLDEGVIVGQGDGPEGPVAKRVRRSRQWEVFTTVNYGNVKLSSSGGQAGVQVDAWAPGVGLERHLSRGLTLGFAASFLHSEQNYTGGLGNVSLEGPAVSAYLSYVRRNFWSDVLYSFGSYELDSRRNPGFGFNTAHGNTRTYTNAVQYNTGWNFRFQDNTLVTGPFAGIDYLHGSVDAYSEDGAGAASLRYGKQTYESLVTRVGWSVSKKLQTSFATITPQVRLSYERQNLKNNGTSVALINAPFTATGGNQNPGQDYLVAGAGVNFEFSPALNLMVTYQGQFFRDDLQAHFAGVRLGYKF